MEMTEKNILVKYFKTGLLLIFFGFLWGIVELIIGELLYQKVPATASIWLTVWAMFILGVARSTYNTPGSSSLIGIIASIFKLIHTEPFFCHLLAIVFAGVAFDVVVSLLMIRETKVNYRSIFVGFLGVFLANIGFSLSARFILHWPYWTHGSVTKIINYIFVNGTIAAILAAIAVPVGFFLGTKGILIMERRPQWSYIGLTAAILCIWTLGTVVA